MVVAPKTLLAHWARELGVCGVGRQTHEFFGTEAERCHPVGGLGAPRASHSAARRQGACGAWE